MNDLIRILGLEIGNYKPEKLRYGEIVITTDQDPDGIHIRGLLINFFNCISPELLEDGKVSIMDTPLAIIKDGKEETEVFSVEELNKTVKKNSKVRYLKGLGSNTTDDFKRYMSNLDSYKRQLKCGDNYKDELEMAFGSNVQLRKDWLR